MTDFSQHTALLRSFCHAAKTSNFSKTAEQLGVSQPTISLQIQSLEKQLGVTLFARRGPKITLTPEGQQLYDLVRPLLDGLSQLPNHFAAQRGQLQGELNIAAGESTILYLLPDVLIRYAKRYPAIRIRLYNGPGRQGLAMLRSDAVDFAVGSFRDAPDDVCYRPVFDFEPFLITPLEHPLATRASLTLADISPYGLILPPRHLLTFHMVEMVFQQQNLPFTVALEAGGWEVIKTFVDKGLGISIVSGICLQHETRFAMRSLSAYFPKRCYGVVVRRGRYLSPAARRFIECLDPQFFAPEES